MLCAGENLNKKMPICPITPESTWNEVSTGLLIADVIGFHRRLRGSAEVALLQAKTQKQNLRATEFQWVDYLDCLGSDNMGKGNPTCDNHSYFHCTILHNTIYRHIPLG